MKKNLKYILLFSTLASSLLYCDEKKQETKVDEKSKESQTIDVSKPPTLKISGVTVLTAAGVNQKETKGGKGGGTPTLGIGLSDLYFTATGESSSGITYKWRMNVTAIPNVAPTIDRNYIEFGKDNLGTTQVGSVSGPEDTMAETALRLMGGSAGMDGTFAGLYNMSSGVAGGVHPYGYTKRASKIVYMTPRLYGFQYGIAYTPNTSNSGRNGRNQDSAETAGVGNDSGIYPNKDYAPFGLNNVAMGLSYANAWEDLSFKVSGVYVREKSKYKNIQLHNASSYQIGTTIGYKNMRFTTSYMNNGKSRLPKQANQILDGKAISSARMNEGNAGRMWDAGVQYSMGQYQFAAGYFSSVRKVDSTGSAKSRIVTLTADYKCLPGLTFFGEVDIARSKTTQSAINLSNSMKSGSAVGNNTGKTFIVGTKLSF